MLKHFLPSLLLMALPVFGDSILARAEVPNRIIPQGEVRLVEHGAEVVVQTLIQTHFPNRVRSNITKNERGNWPGNPEMEVYVAALEEAFAEYGNRTKGTSLAIEFVAGSGGTRVDFSFPPAAVWRSLPLSAAYVQKNQEYILAEAFGKQAEEIIKLLRKLNPTDQPHGK